MTLTAKQVYDLARGAGFPPETARKMVAIAQRESGFNPEVVGTINAAKERSYGLWQINWKDAGIRALLIRAGISEPDMLHDPATNARAAAMLWAGDDRNLNTAWYTERVGLSYQQGEKYRANLAALPPVGWFEGGNGVSPGPSGSAPVIEAGGAWVATPYADEQANASTVVLVAVVAVVAVFSLLLLDS